MSTDSTDYALPSICTAPGDQKMVELARADGFTDEGAKALAAIDTVWTQMRRTLNSRDFGRQVIARVDPSLDVAHLDVIMAIAPAPEIYGPDAPEVTVGLIGERLGFDHPSKASRLVAEVVERGYVRRVASQLDSRRTCLELNQKAQGLVDAVRQNKYQLFSRALGKWNERELVVFAALFERFQNWSTEDNGIERSAENIRQLMAGRSTEER